MLLRLSFVSASEVRYKQVAIPPYLCRQLLHVIGARLSERALQLRSGVWDMGCLSAEQLQAREIISREPCPLEALAQTDEAVATDFELSLTNEGLLLRFTGPRGAVVSLNLSRDNAQAFVLIIDEMATGAGWDMPTVPWVSSAREAVAAATDVISRLQRSSRPP